jgi:hypothetical protein
MKKEKRLNSTYDNKELKTDSTITKFDFTDNSCSQDFSVIFSSYKGLSVENSAKASDIILKFVFGVEYLKYRNPSAFL